MLMPEYDGLVPLTLLISFLVLMASLEVTYPPYVLYLILTILEAFVLAAVAFVLALILLIAKLNWLL